MLENITEVKKITSSMIRYLEGERNFVLAEILKGSYPSSEEIDYDNWNGGTYIYSCLLYTSKENIPSARAKSKLITS